MRAVALLSLTVALLGCATSGGGGGGDDFNPNVLTRQEILDARATNLWEVVNNLRPRWFQINDTPSLSSVGGRPEILVFRDNVRLGGPEALRNLNPEIAQEIRWMDRMEANSRYSGSGGGGEIAGAIVVVTRSP